MPSCSFLLPLVVLGILSMAFLAMFVHSLGTGYSTQVQHSGEVLHAVMIADSVYNQVLGHLREKPYSKRFFLGNPFQLADQSLLGGKYDLFVEDASGLPKWYVGTSNLYHGLGMIG